VARRADRALPGHGQGAGRLARGQPLRSGGGDAINKPRTVLKQQQQLREVDTLLKRIAESPALQG
jgi:hypothetical protein